MPGREDFGIVRLRVLTDPRVHDAAARFVKARIAKEATALSTVAGVLALLGGALARDTDDGNLPGDAVFYLGMLGYDRRVASAIIESLRGADLMDGARLRGFDDCYSSLLKDRAASRGRREAAREAARQEKVGGKGGTVADGSANRRGTDADGSPVTGTVRTGPVRTEPGEAAAPPAPASTAPAPAEDPRTIPEPAVRGLDGKARHEFTARGLGALAAHNLVSRDLAGAMAQGATAAELAEWAVKGWDPSKRNDDNLRAFWVARKARKGREAPIDPAERERIQNEVAAMRAAAGIGGAA